MSVLDGRNLRFARRGEDYAVTAVTPPGSALRPFHVPLGRVKRGRRSTDRPAPGNPRLRKAGKGATVWRAYVPGMGELQRNFNGGYRLEERGQAWDRREDAARALAAWYDQEEERR